MEAILWNYLRVHSDTPVLVQSAYQQVIAYTVALSPKRLAAFLA